MSFADKELSLDSGNPVELIEIAYSSKQWFYTSGAKEIEISGVTYSPIPWQRGDIEQQLTGDKVSLTVTFPHDVPFADIFRVQPPSETVSVLILGGHSDDLTSFLPIWIGQIKSPDWKYPVVEFLTENLGSSMRRMGLRRKSSIPCGHSLYGPQCGLARDDFKVPGTASTANGRYLLVPQVVGTLNGYFAGGYVTWLNSVTSNPERRMIVWSDGSTGQLTLNAPVIGLPEGNALNLYPGCDRTITTCHGKFNNSLNHGGFPYMPTVNPFTGTTMY